MAYLELFQANRLLRSIPLEGDDAYIGRKEDCHVALDAPNVSRRHAKLRPMARGWRIVDLKSVNGTAVNGELVHHADLRDGDKIEVGDFCLVFREGALSAAQAPPPAIQIFQHAFPPDSSQAAEGYEKLRALFTLTSQLASKEGHREVLGAMLDVFVQDFGAQRALILLSGEEGRDLAPALTRQADGMAAIDGEISRTVAREVARSGHGRLVTDDDLNEGRVSSQSIIRQGITSILCAPLVHGDRVFGVVYLDSLLSHRIFTEHDLALLEAFARQASLPVWNAVSRRYLERDLRALRQLHRDRTLTEHDFENVVARDVRMKTVLGQVLDVSASDTTTLLLGESGTGKELLARAIHHQSPRRNRPFVAVNCMALSEGLVESELFGHEKGAFTGATERKIGRFELADGGSLFLDEVGELSLNVQVKLLRVLQERQFERLGGTESQSLDVRVLAATNADLEEKIRQGEFREDLYYRLAVFTIDVPPLRDRGQDVMALAAFFVEQFNGKMGKAIEGFTAEAEGALMAYRWPGNVRELKNVVERAFVLERCNRITLSSLPFGGSEGRGPAASAGEDPFASDEWPTAFNEAKALFERRFLLAALRRHEGNISATARELELPRNTVYRKIEALDLGPEDWGGSSDASPPDSEDG